MRKLLYCFLGSLLLLVFSINASAEVKNGICGDNLTWMLDDDGLLTINGSGEMAGYYDYDWNENLISWNDFHGEITSVYINEGVTSIGYQAFNGCYNLTSIHIADSVTAINSGAFEGCDSLLTITIPKGVSRVVDGLYAGTNLTDIIVSETNRYFSSVDGVLFNKNRTTLITCPRGKTGAYSIPEGVTTIWIGAFNNCSKLTQISIPESVITIEDWAFVGCNSLQGIDLPESVSEINYACFENCANLTYIVIPSNISKIWGDAFEGCALSDIYYLGTEEEWEAISKYDPLSYTSIHFNGEVNHGTCGDDLTWIVNIDGLLVIYGSGTMYDYGVSDNNRSPWYPSPIRSVELKEGITSIGTYAFKDYDIFTNVILPNSLCNIGENAFVDCAWIYNVSFSGTENEWNNVNISDNGNAVFHNSSINYISFPASGVLGEHIMWSLNENGILTISGTGKMYGCDAYDDNELIENIFFAEFDEDFSNAFEALQNYKHIINKIVIEEGITTLRDCFSGWNWDHLTEISLPASLTKIFISDGLFDALMNLSAIHVAADNNYFTSIEDVLFSKDKKVLIKCPESKKGEYVIPDGVNRIFYRAFDSCELLVEVTIPNGLTIIDNQAFSFCKRLKKIYIPDTVIKIGNSTFVESGLTDIYFDGTEEQWNSVKNSEGENDYTAYVHFNGEILNGICGDDLSWSLNKDGLLTVYGTGSMYNDSLLPIENRELIKSVIIDDGVTSIGDFAFWQCSNLQSITLYDSLLKIGRFAFCDCQSLENIYVPSEINKKEIIRYYSDEGVVTITLPKSVAEIGECAFSGANVCHRIEPDYVLPYDLTTIDVEAFSRIPSTFLYISRNVTYIGSKALSNNKQLQCVFFDGCNDIQIAEDAFEGCNELTFIGPGGDNVIKEYAERHGFAYIWCEGGNG